MIEELINLGIPYGLFGVLFIWLLYTTNKRNESREKMYQQTIRDNQDIIFTQAQAFTRLSDDLTEIKQVLRKK